MKPLISAHNLTQSAMGRTLFKGLNMGINQGDRIGLIGPNGAGKSTLLKILSRAITPESGHVSWSQGLRIAALPQVPVLDPNKDLFATLLEKTIDPDDGETLGKAWELVSKLGFSNEGYSEATLVGSLSGGWMKRVALGRELMTNPDLLFLDEPTNHLDVESIEWLEEYLGGLGCTTLTVTHDRYFLNHASNIIWELDPRNPEGLLVVRGDYADYCEIRDQLIDAQHRREAVLKNTLRRETEWVRREAAARTTKQKARIIRHGDLAEDVADVADRNKHRQVDIEFQAIEGGPKRLVEVRNLSKGYGDRKLFSHLNLTLMAGSRLGILGRNGAGKSTLLRTLLGEEAPDGGERTAADHIKIAYFSQRREELDPTKNVLKTLCPEGDYVKLGAQYIHIRGYMERFLFSDEFANKKVSQLSGGEQARLLIAKLMLTEANLLVLDEPTNDLDLVTLSVLEESLRKFPGALLIVSHDRYFLEQVSTQFLALGDGEAVTISSLDQWRRLRAARENARNAPKTVVSSATKTETKLRKLSFKDQHELDGMEATILAKEGEVERLTREIDHPSAGTTPGLKKSAYDSLARLQREVETLYARWAELEKLRQG